MPVFFLHLRAAQRLENRRTFNAAIAAQHTNADDTAMRKLRRELLKD